ncbi:MAG TPA: CesT family type III secretion system chaperone [Herbaspirillum sp.]
MSKTKYLELIDEICRLTGGAQPGAICDGAALLVGEVAFSLLHDAQVDDALLFVYADFGALPRGRELQAALALLEANLFLHGGAAPVFAVSAGSERVTMAHHCALAGLDARDLHTLLVGMAAKARQWRNDYFLDPATYPFQLHGPAGSTAVLP